jgi:hypothetical protein
LNQVKNALSLILNFTEYGNRLYNYLKMVEIPYMLLILQVAVTVM